MRSSDAASVFALAALMCRSRECSQRSNAPQKHWRHVSPSAGTHHIAIVAAVLLGPLRVSDEAILDDDELTSAHFATSIGDPHRRDSRNTESPTSRPPVPRGRRPVLSAALRDMHERRAATTAGNEDTPPSGRVTSSRSALTSGLPRRATAANGSCVLRRQAVAVQETETSPCAAQTPRASRFLTQRRGRATRAARLLFPAASDDEHLPESVALVVVNADQCVAAECRKLPVPCSGVECHAFVRSVAARLGPASKRRAITRAGRASLALLTQGLREVERREGSSLSSVVVSKCGR